MGKVKIPYYVVKHGKGFWQPTTSMKALGFCSAPCGPDGPAAWAKAMGYTASWHRTLKEGAGAAPVRAKAGTLAAAFEAYRETPEWTGKAERTREDWDRAWKWIGPAFGGCAPSKVTLADISGFRAYVEQQVSTREAHRCIKIWRAMWQVAAALKYCSAADDPSFGVRNVEPKRRKDLWLAIDAVRLAKAAWRGGYRGLAAIIAVAWDSSLSPVDVRSLTPAQRDGDHFTLNRAKTGADVLATISRRSARVLDAYLELQGVEIAPAAPIFRNRSGRPYSKDTLGDDFRDVRALVFGPDERRTLADFRRSGAVEAIRGGATAEQVGHKLGNDFGSSAALQKTYAPVDLATVRQVDQARRKGRTKS